MGTKFMQKNLHKYTKSDIILTLKYKNFFGGI